MKENQSAFKKHFFFGNVDGEGNTEQKNNDRQHRLKECDFFSLPLKIHIFFCSYWIDKNRNAELLSRIF